MSLNLGWRTRPTRYELIKLEDRFKLATRAHDLLEEKYKMLNLESHKISDLLSPLEKELAAKTKNSYRLFFKAIMRSGLKCIELAARTINPNDEIKIDWKRVHGLSVPSIKSKIKRIPDPTSPGSSQIFP